MDTPCIVWPFSLDPDGYPRYRGHNRPSRVAYQGAKGLIPAGLEIDHLCRNRACVNPDHLEAVTHAENMRRAHNPKAAQTHCIHGHPFDEANTYKRLSGGGHRGCRACNRDAVRRYKSRQTAS